MNDWFVLSISFTEGEWWLFEFLGMLFALVSGKTKICSKNQAAQPPREHKVILNLLNGLKQFSLYEVQFIDATEKT